MANTNPTPSLRDIQCEIIADDFAIGFKNWMGDGENLILNSWHSDEELLQIYKKEKGL